jgi:hypothetical protein
MYVHLTGWAMVYNCVFHYFMPAASVAGFLFIGPRVRFSSRQMVYLVWPVLWLVYTMVRGAVFQPEFTGFAAAPSHYPYEFLDVDRVSMVEVIGSIAFLTLLLVGIGIAYIGASHRLVAGEGVER